MRPAAVAESAGALPAIQTWWPYLTSGARHTLLARQDEEVDSR